MVQHLGCRAVRIHRWMESNRLATARIPLVSVSPGNRKRECPRGLLRDRVELVSPAIVLPHLHRARRDPARARRIVFHWQLHDVGAIARKIRRPAHERGDIRDNLSRLAGEVLVSDQETSTHPISAPHSVRRDVTRDPSCAGFDRSPPLNVSQSGHSVCIVRRSTTERREDRAARVSHDVDTEDLDSWRMQQQSRIGGDLRGIDKHAGVLTVGQCTV